jgi:hypothetical protein
MIVMIIANGVALKCLRLKSPNFGPQCGEHRCTARGGHGLTKVSLVPTMPDFFMSCGRAIP